MFHEYDKFSWYSLSLIRLSLFIYFYYSIYDELLKNNLKENIRKFSKGL